MDVCEDPRKRGEEITRQTDVKQPVREVRHQSGCAGKPFLKKMGSTLMGGRIQTLHPDGRSFRLGAIPRYGAEATGFYCDTDSIHDTVPKPADRLTKTAWGGHKDLRKGIPPEKTYIEWHETKPLRYGLVQNGPKPSE